MKFAIPHWLGRVSPVFDVAGRLLVVTLDGPEAGRREEVAITEENPCARAALLVRLGVGVLICGAISRPLEMAVAAAGIEVLAQTCGDVEQVLAAYLDGRIVQDRFLMPGCCGRRRRGRHGRGCQGRRDETN
jgi:predicted Fe-Mo cluster-binding NifX family protein